jgi:predicted RNase H-like HicB family nuclease
MATIRFTAAITEGADGTYWAEVQELPGCFASGHDFDELKEALVEAIQMCLPDGVDLGDAEVERVDPSRVLISA